MDLEFCVIMTQIKPTVSLLDQILYIVHVHMKLNIKKINKGKPLCLTFCTVFL